MKINIAPKLFIGFLVIILLNASFVVIVSKLTGLNLVTSMLKKQNEIKNLLIQIENIHSRQKRSRYIYEKIGREESAQNFDAYGNEVNALIDSAKRDVRLLVLYDSTAHRKEPPSGDLQKIEQAVEDDIARNHSLYTTTFNEMVVYRHDPVNRSKSDRIAFFRTILDSSEQNLLKGIGRIDSLMDLQTKARIKDVESYIDNVRKLTLAIVTVISLFSLIFGIIFSRMITNSLRRLHESTRTIAKGEFDFVPQGYPNDEIGDLAQAFFDMAHDLKKAQTELIRSKRLAAIGEIVASVNHEINNPLMIISGNAQFLEMSMEEYPQEMKDRVRAILNETERISLVTRKLRDIRKPVVEDYTTSGEQMINLDKSAG